MRLFDSSYLLIASTKKNKLNQKSSRRVEPPPCGLGLISVACEIYLSVFTRNAFLAKKSCNATNLRLVFVSSDACLLSVLEFRIHSYAQIYDMYTRRFRVYS